MKVWPVRITRTWHRIGLALALIVALGTGVAGQGTVSPYPRLQFFTNNGQPVSLGTLTVYEAGTLDLADVYTTSALTTLITNPIQLNAAGRPTAAGTETGVFLTPGQTYDFTLKNSLGATIWTQPGVSAVPLSASSVDVTGTAGEAISAGDAVYLSDGLGGTTPGQWYLTDADTPLKSTSVSLVGIAPEAITSGSTGAIRLSGAVTVTGSLSTGAPYYASATAGALTATAPTNAIRIGQAQSSTVLIVGNTVAPVGPRAPPCGRLTLTTGVPVTTTDVTAATTVYYTPYQGCNQLSLFSGSAWQPFAFTQVSIAVPATTSQMYDVFAYDNAGVITLELTAWTNDTTRATALTTQNGVYVKTGALTRLYLGSFRTTGVSGQTEDSVTKRYLWNYYNRVLRPMRVLEGTVSWAYATATYRQANAAATNQLDFVVGVAEVMVEGTVDAAASSDAAGPSLVAIGEDSTTTPTTGNTGGAISGAIGNTGVARMIANLIRYPAAGRHTWVWLERGNGSSTTWQGTANGQSAIWGWVDG